MPERSQLRGRPPHLPGVPVCVGNKRGIQGAPWGGGGALGWGVWEGHFLGPKLREPPLWETDA